MKVQENLFIRCIGDEYMMVCNTPEGMNYSNIVHLSESAAFLLENTGKKEFVVEDWVNLLMEHYEIDEKTAIKDVQELIEELQKIKVVIN